MRVASVRWWGALGLLGLGVCACAPEGSSEDVQELGSAGQALHKGGRAGSYGRGFAKGHGRSFARGGHHASAHGFGKQHSKHHHGKPQQGHDCAPPPDDSCTSALAFTPVATAASGFSVAAVPTVLNNAGLVALTGTNGGGVEHLLLGDGGALTALDVSVWGLERVGRLALDDAADLAFIAATPASGVDFGAFATDLAGSTPEVLYAAEPGGGLADAGSLIASSRIALSPNGTLAFSSIRNGHGALYRGPVTGSLGVLRTGTGAFFNNQELDVNAGGTVAMQMEHGGCGLQRGILLFDTPEPEIADIFKAVAGLNVGQQPDGVLNDSGLVAFAFTGTNPDVDVLRCPDGQPSEHINVALGVYTANPTPFSDPPDLSLVADTTGAFVSFGAVDIDNAGGVVFEANLDAGGRGIFRGADAVADKIIAVGDTLGGEVVTDVQLGQLNDNCQLSFAAVTASGRSVWRASGVAP